MMYEARLLNGDSVKIDCDLTIEEISELIRYEGLMVRKDDGALINAKWIVSIIRKESEEK